MKNKIIILAAGNSTRFHGTKLLARLNGIPMVEHIMRTCANIQGNECVVVSQYDEIKHLARQCHIKYIKNDHSEWGISHSLQLGMGNDRVKGYLFVVADQPFLKRETIIRMLERADDTHIICASYCGEWKNPVYFPYQYREELFELRGDRGGKQLCFKHQELVTEVEVSDKIELWDIDTTYEYQKACQK